MDDTEDQGTPVDLAWTPEPLTPEEAGEAGAQDVAE